MLYILPSCGCRLLCSASVREVQRRPDWSLVGRSVLVPHHGGLLNRGPRAHEIEHLLVKAHQLEAEGHLLGLRRQRDCGVCLAHLRPLHLLL